MNQIRRAAIASAVAALLLILPATACGVTVVKSTNGIIIAPEPGVDLGTVPQVRDYYDYKGGESFSATYPPFNTGSYNSNDLVIASSTLQYDLLEVPLKAGYRIHRIEIASAKADGSGSSTIYSVVLNEPLKVAQQGNVAIGSMPAVAISTMPSVAIDGEISASLDQTLAVDPWKSADLPDGWVKFAYTAFLLAIGSGMAFIFVGRSYNR